MTSQPGTDRRDFMLATALGAVASITLSSDHAAAQTAAAKLPGGTVYTGNIVDGKPVVSTLGVADLEPGKIHRLYFRGVEGPSGQPWLVSVAVLRGANPGKRVTLVSGVHGDEMSSIHAVQTIIGGLDPAAMSGTVMAVFDVSRPAIESMNRRWPNSGRGADLIDLNRVWPGDENAASAPARHAGLVFNRLIRPNSDYVLAFIPARPASMSLTFIWPKWTCRRSRRWRNFSRSPRSLTTLGILVFLQMPSFRWAFRPSRPRSAMLGTLICQ